MNFVIGVPWGRSSLWEVWLTWQSWKK